MKRIVVLSGAGISAESGLQTFRGVDGLWEGYRVEEVASPEGWATNPALVLEFYNQRRPHIVWFGELVPAMEEAVELVAGADVLIVVGTSLQVYPAAGLIFDAPKRARRILRLCHEAGLRRAVGLEVFGGVGRLGEQGRDPALDAVRPEVFRPVESLLHEWVVCRQV